ncbi:MAG: cache domain-containing protein [Desulfomonile tiedjei]|nr:cache domain-containing protein [Desulfomonile tiedjei]
MKAVLFLVGVLLFMFAASGPTKADDAEEVQNLVERAVAMVKDRGKEATLKAVNDRQGPFVKGDLYVFAMRMDNVMVGHPHEHSLRGVNLNFVKDAAETPLFQRFKEVVEAQGSGWVEYQWAKPGSKDPSPKKSFIKKVPGEDLYVGAGYYLDTKPAGR